MINLTVTLFNLLEKVKTDNKPHIYLLNYFLPFISPVPCCPFRSAALTKQIGSKRPPSPPPSPLATLTLFLVQ